MFSKLGSFIYTLRWPIIIFWILVLAACLPILPHVMQPFKTTGFVDEKAQSTQTANALNQALGYDSKNQLMVLYHSPTLKTTDPLFFQKIKRSLQDLDKLPIEHEILLPSAKQQVSKDKHSAYAVIILKTQNPISDKTLNQFKHLVKTPKQMSVQLGGEPLFVESVTHQTQIDLYKADLIAAPVAIITLIFVFGSLTAATLPIVLGGGCAVIILSTLYLLGHSFTLSVFTINIALLLGLCLCLDYALFFISRFRDELDKGLSAKEAIQKTEETAGEAIFFSGLAVFASLSALFLFPINILFSVAVGGMAAVFFAVIISIVLLPAILAVIQNKINWGTLPFFRKKDKPSFSVWRWIAEKVVQRPYPLFFGILALLLFLGYPFLSAQFGVSDHRIFPVHSEKRAFYDSFEQQFDNQELSPINLVVRSTTPILDNKNLSKIYDLVQQLKEMPDIKKVEGIISSNSELKKTQYQQLYHLDKKRMDKRVKQLLNTTTRKNFTVLSIISKHPMNSEPAKELIERLKNLNPPKGLNFELSGVAVGNYDVLQSIYQHLPLAILWIMAFSYLILLILLRSLFLPFKAILMNLLSLCASYGALVFIFQEGHFATLLNFEPQGTLDISLLVIIFCALFGFSMDYEVFLLSRIKEAHNLTNNNSKSIVFGIEKSSRIITSAALIVIVICASFLVADVLMVKAFGLGIAVAIFMDAFLIRSFLVPATMALFTTWNWYLPKWLDRLLPR